MGEERISVIVPAYNTAPWLPRCLDSLMNQSYENLEVIAVNDGSTDDTKAVLDAYAAQHPRVRVIHKENGGVTSARLRGVKEASGSWIGFTDGDDEVEPEMFAHLLENAKASGADISHCGHQVLFPDGRVEAVHGSGVLRQQDRLTGLRDLLDGGLIESSLCTKLIRRELFEGLDAWMDPAVKNNEDYLMNYYSSPGRRRRCLRIFAPITISCGRAPRPTVSSANTASSTPSGCGRRSWDPAVRSFNRMPAGRCCETSCLPTPSCPWMPGRT